MTCQALAADHVPHCVVMTTSSMSQVKGGHQNRQLCPEVLYHNVHDPTKINILVAVALRNWMCNLSVIDTEGGNSPYYERNL